MTQKTSEFRYPPVDMLAVLSMALVILGAILMVSKMNSSAVSNVAYGLDGLAFLILLVAIALLFKSSNLAFSTFWLVFKWTLLVYIVISGFLTFIFVYNHTPSSRLVAIIIALIIFALDVPINISFTVAKSQSPNFA